MRSPTLPLVRRRGKQARVAVLTGLTLLVAATTAGLVLANRDDDTPHGPAWESRQWKLDTISANQRTLTLAFAAGGCTSDRGRARWKESSFSVKVSVKSLEDHREDVACTADLIPGRATVHLERPLRGRRIEGASRIGYLSLYNPVVRQGADLYNRLPRVAGLRFPDAERMLQSHGFKAAPVTRRQRSAAVLRSEPRYRTPIGPRARERTRIRLVTSR